MSELENPTRPGPIDELAQRAIHGCRVCAFTADPQDLFQERGVKHKICAFHEHSAHFTNLPAGAAITPGSTWNFQYWFRDPAAGGAGFNSSDGVAITFQN